MAKRQSRADRWTSAVSEAKAALERIQDAGQELDFAEMESAASDFENAMQALSDVKEEYQEWYDNLPESLQGSATGEKLEAVVNIDVDNASVYMDGIQEAIQAAIEEALAEAVDVLDEAESAELPVGFGRD
jgi:hypothetical protein